MSLRGQELPGVQTHGTVEGKHMRDCCVLSSKDTDWERPTSENAQPPVTGQSYLHGALLGWLVNCTSSL